MYITLEKQYQFFKFLQECNYQIEKIKPEYGELFIIAGYKMPKLLKADIVQNLINTQINIFNANAEVVSMTNEMLNNATNKKDDGSRLADYHNKKLGIEPKKEKDIFAYNNTNIGEITACLANAIGSCNTSDLGDIYKIMDLKDCNIQIARQIKSKIDVASNGNNS